MDDPTRRELRTELTFRLLEVALAESGARARRVPVIQFVVDGAPWMFDIRNSEHLFAPGEHPHPALTLSLGLDVLIRLLTDDDFAVHDDDVLAAEGDLDTLDALAACFQEPESILSIRSLRGTP